MKHLHKGLTAVLATVVAVVMALALVPTAYAADTTTNSLTITNTGATSHTFELYQIFTGTLNETGTKLSDVQWGSGVTAAGQTALGSAAEKAESLSDSSDASNFAKTLVEKGYLTAATTSTSVASKSKYTFDNLTAGYYLVKDVDSSQAGNYSAYTSYIVQVVGSVTQDTKLDVPSVQKKVQERNDSNGAVTEWQDAADYDIGDNVPFQLIGRLPGNFADYKTYKYQFNDTPSAGLTYNGDAKVYVDNGPGTRTDITSSFTITKNDKGVITFTCDDLKAIKGITKDSSIVVEYTAKLNDSAVIGSAGNPNEVSLTYSNNPNYTGEGANSPTGDTPKDKVIVFTYKVVVNKVDKGNNALPGAGFTLKKKIYKGKSDDGTEQYEWTTVKSFPAGTDTNFEFKGLDDGDYQLIESETPSGYNTISPIEFTITANYEIDSDNPSLTQLSGDVTSGEATFTRSQNDNDALTTSVVNKQGSILPSTGGMGTTVLNVAGAAIVVAAGVGLAIRRNKRRDA